MSIEKQVQLLNQLVQIMCDSVEGTCEQMFSTFEYSESEGTFSVRSALSYVQNGKTTHALLADPSDHASDLVIELHAIMKSHTGGSWRSFELKLDDEGKATTKFVY